MERTKRTVWNTMWGFVQKLVMIFSPFIIRTIIIKILGAEYLGLNSLLTSVLQILNMAELGFSSAIVFSLYEPLAQKKTSKVCALMALYRKIYRYIGCGILVVGICLIPFLHVFIKNGVPADINLYAIYLMYLANTVLSYLLFAYKSALLDASQHYDIISKVNTLVLLLQYIAQIAILFVFRNYYLFYILTPICTIIYNLVLSFVVDKKYPEYKANGSLELSELKDLKKRVQGVLIAKVCMVSRNAISSIVVSAVLGLVQVAMFTNYFLIVTSIASFLNVISTSMSASVGNSMSLESEQKNYTDFLKFSFMYAWLSGVIAVCMVATYQEFMTLWVGKNYLFGISMPLLCSCYFFLLSSGDIRSAYMNAKGLWWENRWRTVLESLSNIIFSVVFIHLIGIDGVIVGPMLSLLLFNFIMSTFILYRYCFPSMKKRDYFMRYGKYAIIIGFAKLAVIFFSTSIASILRESHILNFFICGLFAFFLTNFLLYASCRNDKYFALAQSFICRLIKR